MKSFSITQLEIARKNPSNFANSLKEGTFSGGSFGGRPKSMRWFDAVIVYHTTSDISKAISALEQSFSNRKDTVYNRRELEKLIIALDNYTEEHNKLGYIHSDNRINIKITFSPQVKLTGWIWILNMKSDGGYAGYFVSKDIDEINWRSELRFPVIQEYIANSIYGCALDNVDVGIIDFHTGKHYHMCYSEESIKDAITEINNIGRTISTILS